MRKSARRMLENDTCMYFELYKIQQANQNQEVVEEEAVEGLGPTFPPPLTRHRAGQGQGVDLQ